MTPLLHVHYMTLPYNLHYIREFISLYQNQKLYNAAASPASRPRSAGSLAIKIIQYVMQISAQSNVVVARQ